MKSNKVEKAISEIKVKWLEDESLADIDKEIEELKTRKNNLLKLYKRKK